MFKNILEIFTEFSLNFLMLNLLIGLHPEVILLLQQRFRQEQHLDLAMDLRSSQGREAR